MAYVFKRPDSPFWWCGYTDATGEEVQEAARHADESKIRVGKKLAEQKQSERDAIRYAEDKERLARLQREGKADPELVAATFEQLCTKYLNESAIKLESIKTLRSRAKHLNRYFAGRMVLSITEGDVESFCAHRLTTAPPKPEHRKKPMGLPRPATVERDRALLRRMFGFAIKHKMARVNPVKPDTAVPQENVPIRVLEVEQVQLLLAHAPEEWRGIIAVAVYCGLRKGEVFALRVQHVDLERGVIEVHFSHARTTTKSRKMRIVPIPPELVPYLKVELGRVRSEFLFPGKDGQRRSKHTKTEKKIRQAAIAAGLVVGFDHICRRCKRVVERRADAAESRCLTCGMRLWVRPIPMDIIFKDTRSTYGTVAYEATDDQRFVTEALGHHDERITQKHYSKQRLAHLSRLGSKISYGSLTLGQEQEGAMGSVHRIQPQFQDLAKRARPESNGEPSDSKHKGALLDGDRSFVTSSQSLALTRPIESPAAVPDGTICHPVSDDPLTLASEGAEPLLDLHAVAARLSVHVETVRRLIGRGELAAVRLIHNRYRVRPSDLATFIARGKP